MQVAYFNGYARWTYLTTPFFMTMPGFQVTEIEPWSEGAETWRGLRVRYPEASPATASSRNSISGPISCSVAMTIGSGSGEASPSRNMWRTSSTRTASGSHPCAVRTYGALEKAH